MGTVKSPAEQRVVLRNVSWDTYESLLESHESNSAPRFTYDQGEMEVVSPSPEHERLNRRIAQLVLAFTEEMDIESEDLGSTTFRREDPERGFEPDSCLYIQNEERVPYQACRAERVTAANGLAAGGTGSCQRTFRLIYSSRRTL